MGCFDTLSFKCPSCGEITSEQSKASDCSLGNFTLDNAPLLIIADINDEGDKGRLYCENCGVQLELEVKFIAIPKLKLAQDNDDNLRIV